jgi:hypothetical protein
VVCEISPEAVPGIVAGENFPYWRFSKTISVGFRSSMNTIMKV